MLIKKCIRRGMVLFLSFTMCSAYAQTGLDGLGQIIRIHTRLHSFVGKPAWLIIIRDLDNNQTLPYLYDFTRGENVWFAFTFGRNYLILSSSLQITMYRSRYNKYKTFKIANFCNLESNGHIIRGQSIRINLSGDLSPTNHDGYTCEVTHYRDDIFYIAPSNES